MIIPSQSKKTLLFALFVMALVFSVYAPVLWVHPTLQLDDQDLLRPLQQVQSFKDYQTLVSKHEILDIQPIRDLSFWLELKVEENWGIRNSQLINVAIWIAILFFSFFILENQFPRSPWNPILTLLLAVHPVVTTSVAWTSSRKHLLSALFLMVATWLSLKRNKNPQTRTSFLIVVFFALSLFSQPISLAWPLWLGFYFYQNGNWQEIRQKGLLGCLCLLSLVAAYLNYRYYTGWELSPETPPKINSESVQNVINRILVLGRYTFQILLPIRPVGLPYRVAQWPSFVGLFLCVVLALVQWKQKVLADGKWLLFMFLPVAVMTVRLTHHAGYDTYILVSVVGFVFILGSILQKLPFRAVARSLSAILIGALAVRSFAQAEIWTQDEKVFRQAYENEKTILATTGEAKLLLDRHDFAKASELIEELETGDPTNRELPALKGRFLFLMDLPAAQKREVFAKNEIHHPWYQYYFAAFEASEGHYNEAHLRLLSSWKSDAQAFRWAFSGNEKILFSNWKKICLSASRNDCTEIDQIEMSLKPQKKSALPLENDR